MLKIRRSRDRLIFNMGIPIPGKDGLYIETGPCASPWNYPVPTSATLLCYPEPSSTSSPPARSWLTQQCNGPFLRIKIVLPPKLMGAFSKYHNSKRLCVPIPRGPKILYKSLSPIEAYMCQWTGSSLCELSQPLDFKNVIFNLVLLIGIFRISYDNAHRWMPQEDWL